MRLTLRCYVAALAACLAFPLTARAADQSQPTIEPNYRVATQWWSELTKKWTPVGWKSHVFRSNVLFNGAVVVPTTSRRSWPWDGQGVLFWPSLANPADDGTIRQAWRTDHETPVLWTDWSPSSFGGAVASGLPLRQEMFAHVPGAGDLKTGVEPMFLWTRVSIPSREPASDLPAKYTLSYKFYGPEIKRDMVSSKNLRYPWDPYPRKLSLQPSNERNPYALVSEPDGKIRLAIAAQKGCKIDLRTVGKDAVLNVEIDLRQPNDLALVLPMIPTPKETVETECRLGYEKALAEADAYWGRTPATAATIDVPEEEINRAIRSHLKMAGLLMEKNPKTGDYGALTGSWEYEYVWLTPSALQVWLLDAMGYHGDVELCLAMFKKNQGRTLPPGKAFKAHPGYLGTPREYFSNDWLSDNGALLWAFSLHALLTGDRKFIADYTPAIVKSCEWIRDARRITGHGGIEGILPAAQATDEKEPVQSIFSDGWNYRGLATACRLLKRIEHPRAAEFEAEARDYREKFRRAFAEVAKRTPTWTDAAGKVHPMAPRTLSGDKDFGIRGGCADAFYLDTGPMFLVFAGLMDADEEPIRTNRAWYREGPNTKTYRDDGNLRQPASLHHEMSSCEPVYSWVFFHSWQLGDRLKYLEGMYSLFAGACSQTYTVCETRGGITGCAPWLPTVWLARLAVMDDQLREDELHLLRLMPLAWLRTDREARFQNMPTEFGPMSLSAKLDAAGRELQLSFAPKFRTSPKRISLHIPPVTGLTAIRLNGKSLAWDGKQTVLVIDVPTGNIQIDSERR